MHAELRDQLERLIEGASNARIAANRCVHLIVLMGLMPEVDELADSPAVAALPGRGRAVSVLDHEGIGALLQRSSDATGHVTDGHDLRVEDGALGVSGDDDGALHDAKPCTSCGTPDAQCEALIRQRGRGCCAACYVTRTHQ